MPSTATNYLAPSLGEGMVKDGEAASPLDAGFLEQKSCGP